MEELIAQISQKTGLPADQARSAADAVIAYLKGKLPAALGSQLDSIVGGTAPAGLGDVVSKLGGLFGKQ